MRNGDKLIGLVEQAACSINMLSPTELSDVESLQTILDQINHTIADISDGPTQLLEQAQSTTSDAVEVLQKMLQQEAEDTAQSIEAVSQAVCALQGLIDEITQANTVLEPGLAAQDSVADAETTPQQATLIPEEDVPYNTPQKLGA